MYLRTLTASLILLAGSVFTSLASTGVPLQDTVKKVYIRVIAAEKPKDLSIDNSVLTGNTELPGPVDYTESSRISRTSTKRPRKPAAPARTSTEIADRIFPVSSAKQPVVKNPGSGAAQTRSRNQEPVKDRSDPKTADASSVADPKKDLNEEVTQAQTVEDSTVPDIKDLKTSKTYLWVGIVLVVAGIILGILFGKTALLISIAGMIFVIIGYTIKS